MRYTGYGTANAAAMRFPKANDDPRRQGNLVVLKACNPKAGEKGVLYLQYTESISCFAALFDLQKLGRDYRLVLEPSTWGYQDESFLLLVGREMDVIVQAQDDIDHRYIESLGCNLHPIRIGAGDWIDPNNFGAMDSKAEKRFDFVMVASWSPVKRHRVFFAALAAAGLSAARVALIGYPWAGGTRGQIEKLALQYGLSQLTVYERIPAHQVAGIIRKSKVGVMLSKREGANRGIYECLFCDVPVLLSAANRGVNKAHINAATGRLATDEELPRVLSEMLERRRDYSPRNWALLNTGYPNAWKTLDAKLRQLAADRGERYVEPVAMIKSSPAAAYLHEKDRIALQPEYGRVESLLSPDSNG